MFFALTSVRVGSYSTRKGPTWLAADGIGFEILDTDDYKVADPDYPIVDPDYTFVDPEYKLVDPLKHTVQAITHILPTQHVPYSTSMPVPP